MTQNHLPEWDLSVFYQSMEDPQIKKDLAESGKIIQDFQKKYQGNLANLEASSFLEALQTYEKIETLLRKLYCYASLIYHQDMQDEKRVSFYQDIKEGIQEISTDLIFFTLEINQLSQEVLDGWIQQEAKLTFYHPWLRDLRVFLPYQLSEQEETLLHELRTYSNSNWVRLHNDSLSALRFSYLDKKEVSFSDVMNDLCSEKADVRKEASVALAGGLQKVVSVNCLALNTILKEKAIIDQKRGFKTPIASRNLSNLVEDEVVTSLIDSVKSQYENLSHRYYKLKAKVLGVEKMPFWDRLAPMNFGVQRTFSWEESKKIVCEAYGNFSPELAEIVEKFYARNWIDATLRPGKDNGAFSMGTIPEANPFILVNYHGKIRDVMTVAHELGHGVHQYLSSQQGVLMMDTPLTIAETASVFGEMLTFQSLYQKLTDVNEKKFILASKIEDMLSTVVRQVAFAEFERHAHDMRKEGELSSQQIQALWQKVQSESLGPAIDVQAPEYKNFWVYISHFYHTPFYVYAYAFGDCLVNALYVTYEAGFPNFKEKYLQMLSHGGTKRYDELLALFDLNARDSSFWLSGLSLISRMIDSFEELVAKHG